MNDKAVPLLNGAPPQIREGDHDDSHVTHIDKAIEESKPGLISNGVNKRTFVVLYRPFKAVHSNMTGPTNIRGSVAGMIRSAANDELPPGWLYLPKGEITANTECVLLADIETDDLSNTAATLGFPDEGLATDDLKDIFQSAQRLVADPGDSVLVRAFNYYLKFDAHLPSIDAPDPPPPEVVQADLDRQFYQSLGDERQHTVCRKAGCGRGAVALSVFCRRHHFESVKQRPYPFQD